MVLGYREDRNRRVAWFMVVKSSSAASSRASESIEVLGMPDGWIVSVVYIN